MAAPPQVLGACPREHTVGKVSAPGGPSANGLRTTPRMAPNCDMPVPSRSVDPALHAPEAWAYVGVDNISATATFGGRGRSSTAWLQSLRRRLHPLLQHAIEIYVPSQHVTGAEGLIPSLQARCDALAADAHQRAAHLSLPCPEFLQHETLLYLGGALVVDIGLALDDAYRSLVLPPADGAPPVP